MVIVQWVGGKKFERINVQIFEILSPSKTKTVILKIASEYQQSGIINCQPNRNPKAFVLLSKYFHDKLYKKLLL